MLNEDTAKNISYLWPGNQTTLKVPAPTRALKIDISQPLLNKVHGAVLIHMTDACRCSDVTPLMLIDLVISTDGAAAVESEQHRACGHANVFSVARGICSPAFCARDPVISAQCQHTAASTCTHKQGCAAVRRQPAFAMPLPCLCAVPVSVRLCRMCITTNSTSRSTRPKPMALAMMPSGSRIQRSTMEVGRTIWPLAVKQSPQRSCRCSPGCVLTDSAVLTGQNVYLDNVFPLTPMAGRHLVEVKLGASYVCGGSAQQAVKSSSRPGMLHDHVDSKQASNACCMCLHENAEIVCIPRAGEVIDVVIQNNQASSFNGGGGLP